MIKLVFDTEREDLRELGSRYWNLDEEGQFVEDVSEIGENFGLTRHQVLQRVRDACTAISTTDYCPGCGKPRIFDSRQDFRSRRVMRSHTCDDCLRKRRRYGLRSERSGVSTTSYHDIESTNHGSTNPKNNDLERILEDLRDSMESLTSEMNNVRRKLDRVRKYMRLEGWN